MTPAPGKKSFTSIGTPARGSTTDRTCTTSVLSAVDVACTTSPRATYRTGMTNGSSTVRFGGQSHRRTRNQAPILALGQARSLGPGTKGKGPGQPQKGLRRGGSRL